MDSCRKKNDQTFYAQQAECDFLFCGVSFDKGSYILIEKGGELTVWTEKDFHDVYEFDPVAG